MIDYFALALGHGLLAFALLRLALRADVDGDPLITSLTQAAAARRKHSAKRARGKAAEADKADPAAPPASGSAQG